MDRQTNCQKREMPLKLIKFYKIFFTGTRTNVLFHLIYFSGISKFLALFRLSVSEARPLSVSVALGMSIRFTGNSSNFQNIGEIIIFCTASVYRNILYKYLKERKILYGYHLVLLPSLHVCPCMPCMMMKGPEESSSCLLICQMMR